VGYDYRADPILGAALAYWRQKRNGRSMPSRRDIDPIEIPKLLPHLQLIDILGSRFRYRLIGTALTEAHGKDYTGRYSDDEDFFGGPRARAIGRVYSSIREMRRPVFLRSRYFTTMSFDLNANRLYLPLADDDREVTMILGALTFESGTSNPLAGAWGSARLAPSGSELEVVDVDSD
jgi:hypothetical protein